MEPASGVWGNLSEAGASVHADTVLQQSRESHAVVHSTFRCTSKQPYGTLATVVVTNKRAHNDTRSMVLRTGAYRAVPHHAKTPADWSVPGALYRRMLIFLLFVVYPCRYTIYLRSTGTDVQYHTVGRLIDTMYGTSKKPVCPLSKYDNIRNRFFAGS